MRKCILHFALFTQFHQCVQQILQVFFSVEFQLKAALALAVDDFDAAAQVFALILFSLCNIIDFEGDLFFGRLLLIHIFAEGLRLTYRQSQCDDLLRGFQLLFFGL